MQVVSVQYVFFALTRWDMAATVTRQTFQSTKKEPEYHVDLCGACGREKKHCRLIVYEFFLMRMLMVVTWCRLECLGSIGGRFAPNLTHKAGPQTGA